MYTFYMKITKQKTQRNVEIPKLIFLRNYLTSNYVINSK